LRRFRIAFVKLDKGLRMAIVLRKPDQLKALSRTIEGDFGSLTIYARRPTVREHIDAELSGSPERLLARLKIITGWDGVNDDNDEPVPFSEAAFSQACVQLPDLLWDAAAFVREIFEGRADSGNSAAPSPTGCAAAPATILPFTTGAGLPDSAG